MTTVETQYPTAVDGKKSSVQRAGYFSLLVAAFCSWEFYLILLVAIAFRFYQIQTNEFNGDQADIFGFAYHSLHNGMLVATSNIASLKNLNPPAIIYFLMIPALFSANPIGGAIATAVLGVLAVIVTYLFTRRYFGRLAAALASGLFATSILPIFYSRFMWNQNLLPLLVPLMMMVLFWGLVDRRKGWFGWALGLLGLLFQVHGSGLMLGFPLMIAVLFAFRTIRWRDLFLGIFLNLLIYSTYILWEFHVQFHDIWLMTQSSQPAVFDNWSLVFAYNFVSPANDMLSAKGSLLASLLPFTVDVRWLMVALYLCGVGWTLWRLIRPDVKIEATRATVVSFFVAWWKSIAASPEACSLLLLVAWTLFPIFYLSRHNISLYNHYFIFLLPGPFIMISVVISRAIKLCREGVSWLQVHRYLRRVGMVLFALLSCFLIGVQVFCSTLAIDDLASGRTQTDARTYFNYYNDMDSIANVIAMADRLAQEKQANHVYISTDMITQSALSYMSESMHTPSTTFKGNCLQLPGMQTGKGIVIIGPYATIHEKMLLAYTNSAYLGSSERRGGNGYKLYLVQPQQENNQVTSVEDQLALLATESMSFDPTIGPGSEQRVDREVSWLVPRFSSTKQLGSAYKTAYNYSFVVNPDQKTECTVSGQQPGDQLLVAIEDPGSTASAQVVQMTASMYTSSLINFSLEGTGIQLASFSTQQSQPIPLKTPDGQLVFTLSPR